MFPVFSRALYYYIVWLLGCESPSISLSLSLSLSLHDTILYTLLYKSLVQQLCGARKERRLEESSIYYLHHSSTIEKINGGETGNIV